MNVGKNIPVSFELFPPNTAEGLGKLVETCRALNTFGPIYFSVTFGAGGANRDKSFQTIQRLLEQSFKVAPHLSCVGLSKKVIRQTLNTYIEKGIDRIVAIRGDLPEGMDVNSGDFQHTDAFIQFIREETGNHFNICVAAYPEFHPETGDALVGLNYFKRKIQAGANVAITQYFYNIDAYFYFLENCNRAGINVPIIPGIMPIQNLQKLQRFSSLCGAEIPAWLSKRLESYENDVASLRAFGIEVVTKLCEDLIKNGAPGLHFYTLNKASLTQAILEGLSFSKKKESAFAMT